MDPIGYGAIPEPTEGENAVSETTPDTGSGLPLTVLQSFRQRVSHTDRWSASDREVVVRELFPEGNELRSNVWRFAR